MKFNSYIGNVELDVLVNGRPIRKFAHNGKIYVEARPGVEYSIRVKNGGYEKKMAVVSVDGINAIDGVLAGDSQNGYLVNGYNSLDVKGFRVSNDKVNAFKFSKKNKSYAAKSEETQGDTSSCGVIAVKIYGETPKITLFNESVKFNFYNDGYHRMDYSSLGTSTTRGELMGAPLRSMNCSTSTEPVAMACCSAGNYATSVPAEFDMGTEFSKKEIQDSVVEVQFEVGAQEATLEIFYASREALIAMGVPVDSKPEVCFPNPFPSKFCKPPR